MSVFNFSILGKDVTTTVVSDESSLDKGLADLLSHLYELVPKFRRTKFVGFDIEKSFSLMLDGVHVTERVSVLKLCSGYRCLIIQLLHFDRTPLSLAKFFDFVDVTFVGVSIKQNLLSLQRDYGIQCRNALDLCSFAVSVTGKSWLSAVSQEYLVDEVLGYCNSPLRDAKCFSLAFVDWGAKILSKQQIMNASIDALLSFEIGTRLIH